MLRTLVHGIKPRMAKKKKKVQGGNHKAVTTIQPPHLHARP